VEEADAICSNTAERIARETKAIVKPFLFIVFYPLNYAKLVRLSSIKNSKEQSSTCGISRSTLKVRKAR
jgi:hypothetical protein